MDSRHRFAVLVLVVLAGCGTGPIGGGQPATRSDTMTAVAIEPVEDRERPTTVPSDVPPGIVLDGAVNVRSLREAHSEYLDGRSYTWELTYSADALDEGAPDREFTRRVAVSRSRFLAEQYGPPPTVNQSLFVNGTGGHLLVAPTNETEFDEHIDPTDHEAYAIGARSVSRYLEGLDLTADVVDRNGRTYFRLYSTTGQMPPALDGIGNTVSNYSVTAYVTPDGLVQTMIVDYDRTWSNSTRHVSFRYDYSDVGSTSVSRPDWVERVASSPEPTPTLGPSTGTHTETEAATVMSTETVTAAATNATAD